MKPEDEEPIPPDYYIKEFSEGAGIPPAQKREPGYTRTDMERMFLYGLLNQRHPSGTFMDEIGEQLKDDKVRNKIDLCLKEIDAINAPGNSKEGSEPKADKGDSQSEVEQLRDELEDVKRYSKFWKNGARHYVRQVKSLREQVMEQQEVIKSALWSGGIRFADNALDRNIKSKLEAVLEKYKTPVP